MGNRKGLLRRTHEKKSGKSRAQLAGNILAGMMVLLLVMTMIPPVLLAEDTEQIFSDVQREQVLNETEEVIVPVDEPEEPEETEDGSQEPAEPAIAIEAEDLFIEVGSEEELDLLADVIVRDEAGTDVTADAQIRIRSLISVFFDDDREPIEEEVEEIDLQSAGDYIITYDAVRGELTAEARRNVCIGERMVAMGFGTFSVVDVSTAQELKDAIIAAPNDGTLTTINMLNSIDFGGAITSIYTPDRFDALVSGKNIVITGGDGVVLTATYITAYGAEVVFDVDVVTTGTHVDYFAGIFVHDEPTGRASGTDPAHVTFTRNVTIQNGDLYCQGAVVDFMGSGSTFSAEKGLSRALHADSSGEIIFCDGMTIKVGGKATGMGQQAIQIANNSTLTIGAGCTVEAKGRVEVSGSGGVTHAKLTVGNRTTFTVRNQSPMFYGGDAYVNFTQAQITFGAGVVFSSERTLHVEIMDPAAGDRFIVGAGAVVSSDTNILFENAAVTIEDGATINVKGGFSAGYDSSRLPTNAPTTMTLGDHVTFNINNTVGAINDQVPNDPRLRSIQTPYGAYFAEPVNAGDNLTINFNTSGFGTMLVFSGGSAAMAHPFTTGENTTINMRGTYASAAANPVQLINSAHVTLGDGAQLLLDGAFPSILSAATPTGILHINKSKLTIGDDATIDMTGSYGSANTLIRYDYTHNAAVATEGFSIGANAAINLKNAAGSCISAGTSTPLEPVGNWKVAVGEGSTIHLYGMNAPIGTNASRTPYFPILVEFNRPDELVIEVGSSASPVLVGNRSRLDVMDPLCMDLRLKHSGSTAETMALCDGFGGEINIYTDESISFWKAPNYFTSGSVNWDDVVINVIPEASLVAADLVIDGNGVDTALNVKEVALDSNVLDYRVSRVILDVIPYTVNYLDMDGVAIAGQTAKIGRGARLSDILTAAEVTAKGTIAGYVFDHGTPDPKLILTGAGPNVINLYYKQIFTVTYQPGDHGSIPTANSGANYVYSDVASGAAVPSAPAVSADGGWRHTGWTPAAPATVTGNLVFTATWELIPPAAFTVTYQPGAHGSIPTANSGANYVYNGVTSGAAVPPAPAVTADGGWRHTGWTPAAPATVTGNLIFTATWEPIPPATIRYTVIFDGNGAAIGANPGSVTVDAGTSVGFLPTPPVRPGYTFNGWNTVPDGSGSSFYASTPVNSNIRVYAQWIAGYVNLHFDLNGGDGTPPASQSLRVGALASPVANPTREGYTFEGWATTPSGGTQWSFSSNRMPSYDVTLYAQWKQVDGGVTPKEPIDPLKDPEDPDPPVEDEPARSIPVIGIGPEGIPLFGENGKAWALLNLICSVACVVTAVAVLIAYLMRSKREENEEADNRGHSGEDKNQYNKHFLLRMATLITAVISVIVFILTEDMRLPMVLVDRWSIPMVLLLAASLVTAIVGRRSKKDESGMRAERRNVLGRK